MAVAIMVTPGRTASESSMTWPRTMPALGWADVNVGQVRRIASMALAQMAAIRTLIAGFVLGAFQDVIGLRRGIFNESQNHAINAWLGVLLQATLFTGGQQWDRLLQPPEFRVPCLPNQSNRCNWLTWPVRGCWALLRSSLELRRQRRLICSNGAAFGPDTRSHIAATMRDTSELRGWRCGPDGLHQTPS
jgi:hypothetical protein